MKATKPLILSLLLILGLTGLALGRDMGTSDRGLTPAASYGKNPNAHRGRRGRHYRRHHNRHRGRQGRHKHGGMKM